MINGHADLLAYSLNLAGLLSIRDGLNAMRRHRGVSSEGEPPEAVLTGEKSSNAICFLIGLARPYTCLAAN